MLRTAFVAREPGARNHRRCALATGVRIVDDFKGVAVLQLPAAPDDCLAALFGAASYGMRISPEFLVAVNLMESKR